MQRMIKQESGLRFFENKYLFSKNFSFYVTIERKQKRRAIASTIAASDGS